LVIAFNWWGRPLFWTRASAYFSMYFGSVVEITDVSTYGTLSVRYNAEGLDTTEGIKGTPPYGYVKAWGHFKDVLSRQTPCAHAWVQSDYLTGGQVTW